MSIIMIEFNFLNTGILDIASKVNNIFALICMLGIGAFIFFRNKGGNAVDKTSLYVLSGLAVVLCVIGAYAHVQTPKNLEEENKKLVSTRDTMQQIIKSYEFKLGECEEARKKSARDSAELVLVKAENKKLSEDTARLILQLNDIKDRLMKGDDNLLALDGRPYGYVNNYAVVKNKMGMWGYLHKGQYISKVDFIYYEACRFYSGMAAVRCGKDKKWGFINLELDTAIPCRYDDVQGFQGDSTKVKLNGKWFWIDKKGNPIENSHPLTND